eukprot:403340161
MSAVASFNQVYVQKNRQETLNNKQSQLISGSEDNNEFQKMEKIIEKIEKDKQEEKDRKNNGNQPIRRLRRGQTLDESRLRKIMKSSDQSDSYDEDSRGSSQDEQSDGSQNNKKKGESKYYDEEEDMEEYYSYYDDQDCEGYTDNNLQRQELDNSIYRQHSRNSSQQLLLPTGNMHPDNSVKNFPHHKPQKQALHLTPKSSSKLQTDDLEEQLYVLTSQNTSNQKYKKPNNVNNSIQIKAQDNKKPRRQSLFKIQHMHQLQIQQQIQQQQQQEQNEEESSDSDDDDNYSHKFSESQSGVHSPRGDQDSNAKNYKSQPKKKDSNTREGFTQAAKYQQEKLIVNSGEDDKDTQYDPNGYDNDDEMSDMFSKEYWRNLKFNNQLRNQSAKQKNSKKFSAVQKIIPFKFTDNQLIQIDRNSMKNRHFIDQLELNSSNHSPLVMIKRSKSFDVFLYQKPSKKSTSQVPQNRRMSSRNINLTVEPLSIVNNKRHFKSDAEHLINQNYIAISNNKYSIIHNQDSNQQNTNIPQIQYLSPINQQNMARYSLQNTQNLQSNLLGDNQLQNQRGIKVLQSNNNMNQIVPITIANKNSSNTRLIKQIQSLDLNRSQVIPGFDLNEVVPSELSKLDKQLKPDEISQELNLIKKYQEYTRFRDEYYGQVEGDGQVKLEKRTIKGKKKKKKAKKRKRNINFLQDGEDLELHEVKRRNLNDQSSRKKSPKNRMHIGENIMRNEQNDQHNLNHQNSLRKRNKSPKNTSISRRNKRKQEVSSSDSLKSVENQNNSNSDNDSQIVKKTTTTQVYKLTTTRYQGMMNEEYNEDDLEIMKTNSERNLLNSKIKNVALKKGIFIGISTIFFIIDSEISWFFTDEYDSVRMIVNVIHGQIQNIDESFIFFAFFFLLKLVACLELLHHYSPLNTSKGRFVGSLSKTQITTSFLVKAWIKTYPLVSLPIGIFTFLLCNSYVMYVIERNAFPTDCYIDDRYHNYSFRNCLWFCIISFLTVGYGDFYPTSIPGRAVNTVIIIGGMVSSATIIGLVHEQMQLTNEEYHVFKFIKTRRKEQLRKKIAAKLVQYLLQMQVQRQKELSKANIKWRKAPKVESIRNQIFITIDKWKEINQELYITNRRDNSNLSEMNHMRNIEEMLSGIVIKGASIWEQIKTDKLQRKLEVEKSFIKSKMEVLKIQDEMSKNNRGPTSLLRFKTQKLGNHLNLSRQQNAPQSQSFRGASRHFNSTIHNKQATQDILSQSSQTTLYGFQKKTNIPVINITNLDRSLNKKHAQSMQNPISSVQEKLDQKMFSINLIPQNLEESIQSINHKPDQQVEKSRQSNIISQTMKVQDDNNDSEIFTDSDISYQTSPDQEKSQQSIRFNFQLFPQSDQSQKMQEEIRPRKKLSSSDNRLSKYMRTRTVAATKKGRSSVGNPGNNISNGGLDLIVLSRLNRQNSNIINREFVIEEDFEEDISTPVSKYTNINGIKNDFSDALNNNDYQSFQNNNNATQNQSNFMGSMKNNVNSNNTQEDSISKSKSLKNKVKFSDEIQRKNIQRQTTTRGIIKPSLFRKQSFSKYKPNENNNLQQYLDSSQYKSDRSLIEAINGFKFEKQRERTSKLEFERCFPEEASSILNDINRANTRKSQSSSHSRQAKKLRQNRKRYEYLMNNFEIQKKIQTTKYYYRNDQRAGSQPKNQNIFNSDSSSLYGNISEGDQYYSNYKVSPPRKQQHKPIQRISVERLEEPKLDNKQDEDSDLNTERTAKEFKLFENERRRLSKVSNSSGRRKQSVNLTIQIPQKQGSIQVIKQDKKQSSPEKNQTQKTQEQARNQVIVNQLLLERQQNANSLLPHAVLLNPPKAVNPLSAQNPGLSTQMSNQFGGKSPIKFRKQNTTFSEQSVKEIQKLLEPIGSNMNNNQITQYSNGNQNNPLQLQQVTNVNYNFNTIGVNNFNQQYGAQSIMQSDDKSFVFSPSPIPYQRHQNHLETNKPYQQQQTEQLQNQRNSYQLYINNQPQQQQHQSQSQLNYSTNNKNGSRHSQHQLQIVQEQVTPKHHPPTHYHSNQYLTAGASPLIQNNDPIQLKLLISPITQQQNSFQLNLQQVQQLESPITNTNNKQTSLHFPSASSLTTQQQQTIQKQQQHSILQQHELQIAQTQQQIQQIKQNQQMGVGIFRSISLKKQSSQQNLITTNNNRQQMHQTLSSQTSQHQLSHKLSTPPISQQQQENVNQQNMKISNLSNKHILQNQQFSKEIGDLKLNIISEKQTIKDANVNLLAIDNKFEQLKQKIFSRFGGNNSANSKQIDIGLQNRAEGRKVELITENKQEKQEQNHQDENSQISSFIQDQ